MNLFRIWNERRERIRLKQLPRYTPAVSVFRSKQVAIVDACTYLVGMREIFTEGIYEFKTDKAKPVILDCGANIGLSILYFKTLYPSARVIAFEPDPNIFEALKLNVASFDLHNVELHQAAIWIENGTAEFKAEGGFSGRIDPEAKETITVPAMRLRDFLCENVDFLKMDIEGAEMDVLHDCADELSQVEKLFVEYHSEYGQPQRLDELLAIIRKAGFRYQIKEAYTARKPFLHQPIMMNMDLQLNIFCFRNAIP